MQGGENKGRAVQRMHTNEQTNNKILSLILYHAIQSYLRHMQVELSSTKACDFSLRNSARLHAILRARDSNPIDTYQLQEHIQN